MINPKPQTVAHSDFGFAPLQVSLSPLQRQKMNGPISAIMGYLLSPSQ